MANAIKIHGRSSFKATITFTDATTNALVDLSAKTLVFETDKAKFRKPLDAYTSGERTARTLYLSRDDVDSLPDRDTPFVILDETAPGSETVVGEGTIKRVGWIK